MNLSVVLQAGRSGFLLAAATIAATLLLGAVLGRWLKIERRTSLLLSVGTAICGGSAIAAVGTVTGAEEGEMTVALGTVFLLNAVALYLFPAVGHLLHLSPHQFGVWAGIAIHDISSVVGATAHYGGDALQTATAVKLSRALWIVPVSFVAARWYRGRRADRSRVSPPIPWFIGLFLLASIGRTLIPSVAAHTEFVSHLATVGLTVTLFLIGSGLSRQTIVAVGWRPLVQGLLLWLFISVSVVLIVLRTMS
jgi:uncharacterized integral membrane protein (TIGR00698 family)